MALTKSDAGLIKSIVSEEFKKGLDTQISNRLVPQMKATVAEEVKKELDSGISNRLIPQIKTIVSLVITKELTEQEIKFEKAVEKYKSEMMDRIDPILKEVPASREERATDSEQHRRFDNRIGVLEKIHPQGQHLVAA